MKQHIATITDFVTGQMDGEQVPPHNSAALERLSEAIAAIQKADDNTLQILALRIVGTVIDRTRSGIGAQQTLQSFIRGGDHA